jgi:hypothetical protein
MFPYPTSRRPILMLSFPLHLRLPRGLFLSGLPTRTLYAPLRSSVRAHLIFLYFITEIILVFGEVYISQSSSLCILPLSYNLISLNPKYLRETLFSNTLSLHFSFNMRNQVSSPHKTTGKIALLCILIVKFLDSKVEGKIFCTEW